MTFVEYDFKLNSAEHWREIVIAVLSENGFDSFEETTDGLIGFLPEDLEDETKVNEVLSGLGGLDFTFSKNIQQKKNWNEEWEKNFNPVVVGDQIYIRADFHPIKNEYPYTIEITPKMSFGTGHHETTTLMLEYMLDINFAEKCLLDMGCGTGVLAIFAMMKNAKSALGIDIDDWAVENSKENAHKNSVQIDFLQGDVELIDNQLFDVIFANINTNILLKQMPSYFNSLNAGNYLYLSGLLIEDEEKVIQKANDLGFKFQSKKRKKEWSALELIKR